MWVGQENLFVDNVSFKIDLYQEAVGIKLILTYALPENLAT